MKNDVALFVLALFLGFSDPVKADTVRVDGSVFDRQIRVDGTRLELKGTALQRYLVFIKGYAGAFYLPENTPGTRALDDVPKYLVLEYKVRSEEHTSDSSH